MVCNLISSHLKESPHLVPPSVILVSVKWPGVWGRKEWAGEGKKEREEREKERKKKVKSKSWKRLAAHCKGKPTK